MTSLDQLPTGSSTTTFTARLTHSVREYAIIWAAGTLFVILSLSTPGFVGGDNLRNILDQQSVLLIAAAPLTLVLIAGNFDVSISAIYITAPLVGIQVGIATGSMFVGTLAGIAAGICAGLVNALLVVYLGITSFISTLASSYVIAGIGYIVSNQSILTPPDAGFRRLATTEILGISSATWWAAIIVAAFWILLSSTRFGRYVYATGANTEAARLSGVRTGLVTATTFVLMGAAAGFAGMINASQSMSAQATDDFGFVFGALAAVVVGGTSIAGGAGAVWRSMIGALFIAMMNNGLNLNQVDPVYQRIILGLVIVFAVGVDAFVRASKR